MAEVLVGTIVCIGRGGQFTFGFGKDIPVAIGHFALLLAVVDPARVSFVVKLAIFTLLDSLLHGVQAVFGILSHVNDAGVDLANIVGEIPLQFLTFRFVARGTGQGFWIGLGCFVAMVVSPRAEDRLIERLEFGEDASLVSENGYPGLFPGLGRVNDLARSDVWSCHHNKGPGHTRVSR